MKISTVSHIIIKTNCIIKCSTLKLDVFVSIRCLRQSKLQSGRFGSMKLGSTPRSKQRWITDKFNLNISVSYKSSFQFSHRAKSRKNNWKDYLRSGLYILDVHFPTKEKIINLRSMYACPSRTTTLSSGPRHTNWSVTYGQYVLNSRWNKATVCPKYLHWVFAGPTCSGLHKSKMYDSVLTRWIVHIRAAKVRWQASLDIVFGMPTFNHSFKS